MVKPKILIVEDEWIIANDLKSRLQKLGYSIPALAATGEEAVKKAEKKKYDLALMDIVLQGKMDGIEAARQIVAGFDIPIIYLTAYTDKKILKEAKKTGAYGYLVKPFKDRELQAAIEMALYKYKMEKKLKESENRLSTTLKSIHDAVISTDKKGMVTFMNPVAQSLTGWRLKDAKEKNLLEIFNITNEETGKKAQTLVNQVMKEKVAVIQTTYELITKDKINVSIECSSAPITDDRENVNGVVLVFRDITERKLMERESAKYRMQLEQLAGELLDANKNLKVEVGERKKAEKKLLEYQKQLQSLASQISLIEEREKRRIATELHDCIGQPLALSKIKLGLLNRTAPTTELKNNIKEILDLIEQTIKETRTLTFELSPPILYELGLSQAIKWLIDQFHKKHGLKTTLEDEVFEKPFDHNIRYFLFQAVRELLVNIVKHAQASEAKIKILCNNNKLRISVEDNGIGFPESTSKNSGYGLFNIREQMNHINGHFEISSKPGRGTQVTLIAPFMPDKKPL
jgi:PAS domain S-box-containing protein